MKNKNENKYIEKNGWKYYIFKKIKYFLQNRIQSNFSL